MNRFLVHLTVLLLVSIASGNDSALNDGRLGPEPVGGGFAEESIIEMAREELHFTLGRKSTHVEAKFVFVSHKKGAEAIQVVGFPDEALAQEEAVQRSEKSGKDVMGPEQPFNGPIRHLVTKVNGQKRKTEIKYGFVEYLWDEEGNSGTYVWKASTPKEGTLMAWHTVQVTFPPGEEVTVERSFDVDNGSNVLNAVYFEYSTHTGAAWKGPIGEMIATVQLEDGLSVQDLAWKGSKLPNADQADYGPWVVPEKKGDWETVSPTELRLHWKNFEPRTDSKRRYFLIALKAPPTEE